MFLFIAEINPIFIDLYLFGFSAASVSKYKLCANSCAVTTLHVYCGYGLSSSKMSYSFGTETVSIPDEDQVQVLIRIRNKSMYSSWNEYRVLNHIMDYLIHSGECFKWLGDICNVAMAVCKHIRGIF